jgi:hypothetical protein
MTKSQVRASFSLYLKEAILSEKKKDWTKDAHIYMPAGSYSTDELSSFSPTILLRLFVSEAGKLLSILVP